MSKRIVTGFKDILLDQIDIVRIINTRLPLKRSGKGYQACCPFHNEKTPSFSVEPQKQFFYCFGCGAKGDVINFLMEHDHLSFVEAIEVLAEEVGIDVEYEKFDDVKVQKRKSLYNLLDDATSLYEKNLFSNYGKEARSYIAKRQLDKETISFFRLGYSLPNNQLQNSFTNKFSDELLEKTGLISRGDRGFYDQFRGRLMFPIRDARGRVLGFGARSLGEIVPKYLNSRETDVFSKRYVLYGLYESLQKTRNINYLVVVEGYTDVIALQQNNIIGAVAALGTAFTGEHLKLARRYTKKIFICFDGDVAGKKAAVRAMETILPVMGIDLDIRFVFLPDGEDPDSLVKKVGKNAFSEILDKGMLFSEFVFQSLVRDSDLGSVEGRGKVVSRAKIVFDNIPDGEYKTLLYQNITEKLGIDIYKLSHGFGYQKDRGSTSFKSPHVLKDKNRLYKGTLESKLIGLLLNFPEFSHYVKHVGMLDRYEYGCGDARLLKMIVMLFQVKLVSGDRKGVWFLDYFYEGDLHRIKEIEKYETFVEGALDTIEEHRDFFKVEFIEGFNSLLEKILKKKR